MPMGAATTAPRCIHPRRLITPMAGPTIPAAVTTRRRAATIHRPRGITSPHRATTFNRGSINRPRVTTSLPHDTTTARTRAGVGTTMAAAAGTTATGAGGTTTTGADTTAIEAGAAMVAAIMMGEVGIGNFHPPHKNLPIKRRMERRFFLRASKTPSFPRLPRRSRNAPTFLARNVC